VAVDSNGLQQKQEEGQKYWRDEARVSKLDLARDFLAACLAHCLAVPDPDFLSRKIEE
jgi:hypothetical protein